GCGKLPVDQIILTHNHFDHAGAVPILKKRYGARVLAFCDGSDVDERICDGQCLRVADGYLDVIHTPEHSSDSICLFHRESGVLFSGDTQLRCRSAGESLSPESLLTLKRLGELPIQTAYTGHNGPIYGGILGMLRESLRNLRTKAQRGKTSGNKTIQQFRYALTDQS
ncbi:MAG: MBL fold metallo-hydrolase, partial [Desulfobulbaceae bacterium]|nr:MBL fold metallo-hydrolase [Desulfobulbaceae bacterium]